MSDPTNNFEEIYEALFALFASFAEFKTKSRKLKHWNDVPAEEQPALFVIQKTETANQRKGLPPTWTCQVDVYIYVKTAGDGGPDDVPSKILNPILGKARDALAPAPNQPNTQTLGGLVSHAWIEGTIETSEGVLGSQEVAIIPVELLVTPPQP